MENIEKKNVISKMKISLDEINRRLVNVEEKISKLEDITIETIQSIHRNYILSSECPYKLNVFNDSYM